MRDSATEVGITRQGPPEYFRRVSSEATSLWQKLDDDSVIAGPWKQLFSQVQSPRHVLSELLQNADDAGATCASASIHEGEFRFTHNGSDFNEEQFASLCRFGFSNKRNLHTIGFRGIGFKSTFSLGPCVKVLTPTLAVHFNKTQFTKPVWIPNAEHVGDTQIRVKLQDEYREAELHKNLQEWLSSPVSLLFFSNLQRLEIDGVDIERQSLGPGPVPRSEWVTLSTVKSDCLLVVRSESEPFPDEAADEIRKERFSDDIDLPPCQVEIVLGLSGTQRLYVVLPTGVHPRVPFSCNAPFVQDPARTGIKDPAVSPTNRWLLDRLGKLAADTMTQWLANESLTIDDRSQAYDLLPEPAVDSDDPNAVATVIICSAFKETIDDSPRVILSESGDLLPANECFAPPHSLYQIWSPSQILDAFGGEHEHLLAHAVTSQQKLRLAKWQLLERTNDKDILDLLIEEARPSCPDSWTGLAQFWQFVSRIIDRVVRFHRRKTILQNLAIVPILGDSLLATADEVVRVSDKRRGIQTVDWQFLIESVAQLHPDWVDEINNHAEEDDVFSDCDDILRQIGLGDTTTIDRIIEHRAAIFFAAKELDRDQFVRFAQLLAALDATAPDCFEYITRDNVHRTPDDALYLDDGSLDLLVPNDWAEKKLIHEDYEAAFSHCTRDQWRNWSRSQKSDLCTASFFNESVENPWNWYKPDAEKFLVSRGVGRPYSFYYRSPSFRLTDYNFEECLRKYWEQVSDRNPSIWGQVVKRILFSPTHEKGNALHASLHELYGSYSRRVQCDKIPSKWIMTLRGKECLPDTYDNLHEPAQLLLRSPDTEPLLGIEPFVNADLDTPDNRDLLLLLGARATPAGAGSILNRLRTLAESDHPPLTELGKWYDALDRVLTRHRSENLEAIRSAFDEQALIYTQEQEWAFRSEVFQRLNEDDPPGLPTIHPEFCQLAIWSLLDIAESPSPDHLVDYLSSIESGKKLDGGQLKRIRTILKTHPSRIWNECEHWLTLDGSWQSTEDFKYILFDDSAVRVRELFPQVKAETADCRSLYLEMRSSDCFRYLEDLSVSLTYKTSQTQGDLPAPEQHPWLSELGSHLKRIRLDDQELCETIQTAGSRLHQTKWQPFSVLEVVPYLHDSPAGQPHEPVALWDNTTLFVKQQSTAKALNAVVAELSRSFPYEPVQRAIRSCYERDASFIRDYLSEQFDFETQGAEPHDDEGLEINHDGQDAADGEDQNENEEPDIEIDAETDTDMFQGDGDEESEEENEVEVEETGVDENDEQIINPPPKPPKPKAESVIAKFAKAKGFRHGANKNEWVHPDGSRLEHTNDIFPWVHRHGDRVIQRYWLSEQSLNRNSGIELSAEVWEMLRKRPEYCSLVLSLTDNRTLKLPGTTIMHMSRRELLVLYPAKFRLVYKGDSLMSDATQSVPFVNSEDSP